MIRKSDLIILALKKLKTRKLRVFFTLLISALGVIIISAGIGLVKGVANEDILDFFPLLPPDTVNIIGYDIPTKNNENKRPDNSNSSSVEHYITDEHLQIIKNYKYFKSITKPSRSYSSLTLDEFISWNNLISEFSGMPDTFIRHYAGANYDKYITNQNKIPVIIDENAAKNIYNSDSNTIEKIKDYKKLIGRNVEIIAGDIIKNDLDFVQYVRDTSGIYVRQPISDSVRKDNVKNIINRYSNQYDLNIMNQTLKLKGVIVGTMISEARCIIPDYILKKSCEWIIARNRLAARNESTLEELYSNTSNFMEDDNYYVLTQKGKALEFCDYLEKKRISATCREKMKDEKFKMIQDQLKMVRIVLYSIAGIVLFFSGMFIWGTIGRVVNDSRREIGVFRAIGATKIDILKIYLTEAGILGGFSAILGIISGQIISYFSSRLIIYYLEKQGAEKLPPTLYGFDFQRLSVLLLAAIFISVLAGFQPAHKASKLDPVIALKAD